MASITDPVGGDGDIACAGHKQSHGNTCQEPQKSLKMPTALRGLIYSRRHVYSSTFWVCRPLYWCCSTCRRDEARQGGHGIEGEGGDPVGWGRASARLSPLVAPSQIPLGVIALRADPRRRGSPGEGGGACIHPPGPTRCTVTDPVGGDSAQSRPTQAERRERARGARGLRGGLHVATAGSAWSDDREIVCEVGGA